MRAEAQAHVDSINEALALLRRFLDWDRALRRLDELNARVEDQALWNDPKAAQEVMRERRRLDEAITATRAIEGELADTAELIELAEAEGDAELAEEGTASLAELAQRRAGPRLAHHRQRRPVRAEPQDLPGEAGRQIQLPIGTEQQTARQAVERPLAQKAPVEIEYLHAVVLAVGDEQFVLRRDQDRVRLIELSRRCPLPAP